MNKNFIIGLISRIHKKCEQRIYDQLKQNGYEDLAPTHGEILYAVLSTPGLSMKSLGELIYRDKSTVTALTKKLEALGYVKRIQNPEDSRQWLVYPTKKGESFKSTFFHISEGLLADIYDGISDAEANKLINTLTKIGKNL